MAVSTPALGFAVKPQLWWGARSCYRPMDKSLQRAVSSTSFLWRETSLLSVWSALTQTGALTPASEPAESHSQTFPMRHKPEPLPLPFNLTVTLLRQERLELLAINRL